MKLVGSGLTNYGRPAVKGFDMHRRLVLLSMPRTGSTMITKRLSNHPKIDVLGDIFGHNGWNGGGRLGQKLRASFGPKYDDLGYRIVHRDEILDRLFSLAEDDHVVGLKHHLTGDETVTEALVDDDSVAVIMLRRPNILASYSSSRLNAARKQAGADSTAGLKVEFEEESFRKFMSTRRDVDEHWLPRIEERAGPHVVLTYNEARTDAGFGRILDMLEIDSSALPEERTEKRNSDDIVSRFSNPDVARAFLVAESLEDWALEEAPASV